MSGIPRRLAWRAWTMGCAALLTAGTAWAQQNPEEGLVFGVRRRPPKFQMEPINGYIEFLAQSVKNSTDYTLDFNSGSETSSTIFTESLFLGTSGYILSPAFIDWQTSGKISFEQSDLELNGESQSQDTDLYEWEARAQILKNSSTPIGLYTSRSQSLVNQSFGPTVRQTNTIYGADFSYQSETFPTEIRLYRSEQSQSSLGGEQDFSVAQNVLEWQSEWRISSRQSLLGRVVYFQTDQTSGAGTSTSSDSYTASLSHSLRMGARQQYILTSSISTSKSTGLFGNETFDWNEELRMYHSARFETDVRYHLNRTTYDIGNDSGFGENITTEQSLQEASAGFRHNLYESLTTTGRVGFSQVDIEGSTNDTTFGTLAFNYTKKIPKGLLLSTLTLNYSTQDSQSRADAIPVVGQPLAVSTFQPVTIQRQDIVPGSLVVRTPQGRILSPITDYRVTYFPNFMRIDPLPGGDILLGDTVLLNYELRPEPAFSSTTQALTYSLRYDIREGALRGLSPYFLLLLQDQSIDAQGPTGLEGERVTDLTFGLDYTVGEFTFNGEYENRSSNLVSFDAWRARARYNHDVGANTRLGLEARYALIDYTEPENQVTTMSAGAVLTHRFSRTLFLTGSVSWLDIQDDISGHTQGLEEQLELRWRNRQLEVFMQLRDSSLETDSSDQSFQMLQFGVRRYF